MTQSNAPMIIGLALVGGALLLYSQKPKRAPGVTYIEEPIPYGPHQNPAIDRAYGELALWRGLTETDPKARPMIDRYWASIGTVQPPSVAWSAAFISYLASGALRGSGSHVTYARRAYQARQAREPGQYWTLRPSEAGQLREGDILLKGRGNTLAFEDLQRSGSFLKSHADMVTTAHANEAKAIGGNVRNSVRVVRYPLTDGRPGAAVVAVLRKQDGSAFNV